MKKRKLHILCLLMLMSIGMAHGQTVRQTVLLGDANDDGVINIADVSATTAIILGRAQAKTVETAEYFILSNSLTGTFTIGGETKTYKNGVEVRHEYVDLGLPSGTLWATCNIGADSPEDYGLYFAWGETTGYTSADSHIFDWYSYKFYDLNLCDGTVTKYCTESDYGTVDNKTILESCDDAATVNWGGSWRMPTRADWLELIENCTWTKTTLNSVLGYTATGTSGKSIFLPAAGDCEDDAWYNEDNEYGFYWANTLNIYDNRYADRMCIDMTNDSYAYEIDDSYDRNYGISIRPVYTIKSSPEQQPEEVDPGTGTTEEQYSKKR